MIGMRRFKQAAVALMVPLWMTAPTRSETWTNAAGHALEATPVELDGKRVVLLLPSGEQLRMPLHSFLPSEQQRIKTFLGVLEIPGPLRSEFKLAESQLEAARSLLNDQAITPEEFNLRKTAVLQAFLRACAAQSLAEDSDMVQRLLRKLES